MTTTPAQPTNAVPRALLVVYSEHGSEILEHEFNKWYDDEHIPECLLLPGCTNASRYRAIDSELPSWAALYHTSSPELTERWFDYDVSDTQKKILEKIPIMTGTVYTLAMERTQNIASDVGHVAGKVICTAHLHLQNTELEASFTHWYENLIIEGVSATPGWLRTTMYKRYTGRDIKTTPELRPVMDSRILVVHEWNEEGDAVEISKFGANVTAQVEIWQKENKCEVTRQVRILSLHREW